VLTRVAADESRASYYARKLLSYLRYRAGVSPTSRRGDPVEEGAGTYMLSYLS
jgi:hypothetical protein